jgi:tetratricopeptide (TPR) repeat protein
MNHLEPPDSLHVQAAEGWLGLGNQAEASEELKKITPELRSHPEVLSVRCEVYAAGRKWEMALEIATALIQLDTESPAGWVHRSYALHELKRTTEARDNLMRVVEKFARNTTMLYNLACYECQLGRLTEAKEWLRKAFIIEGAKQIKLAALEDPDLEPLRGEIEEM